MKPGAAIERRSDRPWKISSIFSAQISEDDRRELALDQQAHEIAKSLLQSYLSYYL